MVLLIFTFKYAVRVIIQQKQVSTPSTENVECVPLEVTVILTMLQVAFSVWREKRLTTKEVPVVDPVRTSVNVSKFLFCTDRESESVYFLPDVNRKQSLLQDFYFL